MITEISRTKNSDGSCVVQRLIDGEIQVVKETSVSSGEIVDSMSEMITTETIVITRRIGNKINF